MDEIVLRGMAKWPSVPAVYGWLSLDRRGHWLIKGQRISNRTVTDFIGRNYARDQHGRWYFQNGPQRVFVGLDYAPFVYRVVSPEGSPLALEAHNGRAVSTVTGAWIDEDCTVLLETELGIGTVHDRDLDRLLPAFRDADGRPLTEDTIEELMALAQQGRTAPLRLKCRDASVEVEPIQSATVAQRFGFVAQPEAPSGEEVCR